MSPWLRAAVLGAFFVLLSPAPVRAEVDWDMADPVREVLESIRSAAALPRGLPVSEAPPRNRRDGCSSTMGVNGLELDDCASATNYFADRSVVADPRPAWSARAGARPLVWAAAPSADPSPGAGAFSASALWSPPVVPALLLIVPAAEAFHAW
jgi:hypothetical protein